MQWYALRNADEIDSPALLIYKDRVRENIRLAIEMAHDVNKFRPHVKTNKIAEVCAMMMEAGIYKFKCATIAEAEMLGGVGAKDVLMAYQPVGPKVDRLLALVKKYPQTSFSCVFDNIDAAQHASEVFSKGNATINVFIDLNSGMNRTGITYSNAIDFFERLTTLPALNVTGLHVYDGHIKETDLTVRQSHSDAALQGIEKIISHLENKLQHPVILVAGGTPTFVTHTKRNVETSPGTFVFWDWGYKHQFPEAPFEYAALVLTRVISIVDGTHITIDLGYKSIASENPLPRVHFLNAPEAVPTAHSEEHLVLRVPDSAIYKTGDVLYGVPVHICPTVALYEKGFVVENNRAQTSWKVVARDRSIGV